MIEGEKESTFDTTDWEKDGDLWGMEEKTKVKGAEQPPTKIGLDDERSKTPDKKTPTEDIGSITDTVMEEQSKHHEVQRT